MNKRIKKKKRKQALENLVNKIKETTNKVEPVLLRYDNEFLNYDKFLKAYLSKSIKTYFPSKDYEVNNIEVKENTKDNTYEATVTVTPKLFEFDIMVNLPKKEINNE